MPGTVTGTIGANAGVYFDYRGTGAALHLDIGFVPSKIEAQTWTNITPGTLSWVWTRRSANAAIGTINGWVGGVAGTGARITTTTSVASINGVQLATDTTVNAAGQDYSCMCWR